jgi:hypothetical protein
MLSSREYVSINRFLQAVKMLILYYMNINLLLCRLLPKVFVRQMHLNILFFIRYHENSSRCLYSNIYIEKFINNSFIVVVNLIINTRFHVKFYEVPFVS